MPEPALKHVVTTRPTLTLSQRAGFLLGLACWLAACGGGRVPVVNVQNAPAVVARGQAPSRDLVRDSIVRALSSRGWGLDREGPDGIVATVVSGGHSATVHIQYDEHTYSIHYLDSSPSLKFDGVSIHRKYNDWVDRLNRAIRANLMNPGWTGVQVVVPVAPEPAPATAPAPLPSPGPGPAPVPPVTGAPAATAPAVVDDAPPPPPPKTPPAAPRK